uniref:Uncharacterized protein n=1 Tax=Arundo donax TaxID=35708 RepID=A0A0A9ALU1_ARUDO
MLEGRPGSQHQHRRRWHYAVPRKQLKAGWKVDYMPESAATQRVTCDCDERQLEVPHASPSTVVSQR